MEVEKEHIILMRINYYYVSLISNNLAIKFHRIAKKHG